jgi:hypothetical protein
MRLHDYQEHLVSNLALSVLRASHPATNAKNAECGFFMHRGTATAGVSFAFCLLQ